MRLLTQIAFQSVWHRKKINLMKEELPYKSESVEEFQRIDTLVSWLQKIRYGKLLGIAH